MQRLSVAVAAWLCMAASQAFAGEPLQLMLKDHRFMPDHITVPSGKRFRIEVANMDPTPAEFESSDLRAEKIVVPGGRISVMAGPLKPGTYAFFDDYHPDAARGALVAVEPKSEDQK